MTTNIKSIYKATINGVTYVGTLEEIAEQSYYSESYLRGSSWRKLKNIKIELIKRGKPQYNAYDSPAKEKLIYSAVTSKELAAKLNCCQCSIAQNVHKMYRGVYIVRTI